MGSDAERGGTPAARYRRARGSPPGGDRPRARSPPRPTGHPHSHGGPQTGHASAIARCQARCSPSVPSRQPPPRIPVAPVTAHPDNGHAALHACLTAADAQGQPGTAALSDQASGRASLRRLSLCDCTRATPCSRARGHQLLSRLRLVLVPGCRVVWCRGHHGTSSFPPVHQARRDRAGNTVRSTVPPGRPRRAGLSAVSWRPGPRRYCH